MEKLLKTFDNKKYHKLAIENQKIYKKINHFHIFILIIFFQKN